VTAKFNADSKLSLTPKYDPLELEAQVRAFWEKNQIPKQLAKIRKENIEYQTMFRMIKTKLAKERNIVL